nr:hypothetical protein [Tanacetum cinerariifolium]
MDVIVHTYKDFDYKETFSPVADIRAIRILIAITAFYDYEIVKVASVATNARQSKGKLHDIFLATSFISPESVKKSINERAQLKRVYDRRVNKILMLTQESKVDSSKALDDSLVVAESSRTESDKQDTSSSSGNDTTHVVDADIRLVNDQEPFAESVVAEKDDILETSVEVDSKLIKKMASADNTSSLTPQ